MSEHRFIECAECGATIARDLERCPQCQHPLDGSEPAAPVEAVAPAASARSVVPVAEIEPAGTGPAGPPATGAGTFRSPVAAARLLRIFLIAWGALAGITIAYGNIAVGLIDDFLADPLSVDPIDFVSVGQAIDRVALIGLVSYVAFIVLEIVWLWRIYGNLRMLGVERLNYGRGWVIGGWFVPFLNFWRPKQLVDEAWTGSNPDAADTLYAPPQGGKPSSLIIWWWGTFLGWLLVRQLATFDVTDIESIRQAALTEVLATGLLAISAVLLYMLVTRLTVRQVERARRLGATDLGPLGWVDSARSDGRPNVKRIAVLAVPALVFLVAGSIAQATLDVSLAGTTPSGEEAILLDELQAGDCFDEPTNSDMVFAVPRRECSDPHFAEFIGSVELADGDYPGEEALFSEALDLCITVYEEYTGDLFWDSPHDVVAMIPNEIGWGLGDRGASCAAIMYDVSERLEAPLTG